MSQQVPAEAERLVRRIAAYNDVWKGLGGGALGVDIDASAAARVAREAKGLLQIALLRGYPELAQLVEDSEADADEALFSVKLLVAVGGRRDACHLPVRLAQAHLTGAELLRMVAQRPGSRAAAPATLPLAEASPPTQRGGQP